MRITQTVFLGFVITVLALASLASVEKVETTSTPTVRKVAEVDAIMAKNPDSLVIDPHYRESLEKLINRVALHEKGIKSLTINRLDRLKGHEMDVLTKFTDLEHLTVRGDVNLRTKPERLRAHISKLKQLKSLRLKLP